MTTKTVTIKGFIVFDSHRARLPSCYPAGPYTFNTYGATDDHTVIQEHTISVEIPADFDPRPGMVKALEAKKRDAEAAFAKLVTDINRQISKLQAIEYSGEAA